MQELPQRSRWSVRKLFLLGGGLVLLAVLGLLGGSWYSAHAELEAQLVALRAEGLPTNVEELADYYRVPDGVTDTTDVWISIIDGVTARTPEQSEALLSLPIVGDDTSPIPPPGGDWPQLEAAEKLLAEFEPQLQAAREQAGSNGQARFPVDFSAGFNTLLPNTNDIRQIARLLQLDAHVAAHRGDHARASQDVQALFAVSNSLRGEPLLISHLVRIAIHAMGCEAVGELMPYCDWSDSTLATLQQHVRSAEFQNEAARATNGELAMCLTELDRTGLGPLRVRNKLSAVRIFAPLPAAFAGTPADCLRESDNFELQLLTWHQQDTGLLQLDNAFLQMAPAIHQCVEATVRAVARQRCFNAAIAAQRYRLQHGQFPQTLSDLSAELLGPSGDTATQIIDPFDDNPLRYLQDNDRVVIYSIGIDRTDNGGDCVPKEDGPGPEDVGVVLPK